MLDELAARNAVTVGRRHAELPKSPGLVRRLGGDQRIPSRDFFEEPVHIVDVPISEIGMIAERAGRLLVHAFTQHQTESIAGEKAPTLGIDRIFLEAQNVHVVTRRYLQVTHR